ncbi:hypothetical protein Ccrd_015923 [Cynara cardunculus var. scolymus]|uniref:Uncharacterized protein n=1 Tax=Cynara cardunculus var. scolymus TaxID=59895 RepID=A0A103YB05_CYNCS|nr:hypothetical protein Ccrd_015923 [Cynara cardunculus var. scolymus]
MEDGLRTRSFRNEDYNTRRAFLTSYPLNFDRQETPVPTPASVQVDGDRDRHTKHKKKKEAMKKIVVAMVEWGGGRWVVIRRFKHKVSFYVVACFPLVFKPPKSFISAAP